MWEIFWFITSLPPIPIYLPATKEVNAIACDVCLSVCLLARLLKNVYMDMDDILRVDSK